MERSRLLGSSDRESLVSPFLGLDKREQETQYPQELSKYVSDHVFLTDIWHGDDFHVSPEEPSQKLTWRVKERMKTAGVALVVCLNIGTDPPDVVKPTNCARMESWIEPHNNAKQKSLELIGNSLQQQYEKWQPKAKYKQCLDPTSEDLRKVCNNLRKGVKNERLLLHYNGHGVPRPTKNGELWVFGKNYTHYVPITVTELRSWLGDPCIFVLDCVSAGVLLPYFADSHADSDGGFNTPTAHSGRSSSRFSNVPTAMGMAANYSASTLTENSAIVLAACKANEVLPVHPKYPADMFTACLTTPIPMALRWLILQVLSTFSSYFCLLFIHFPFIFIIFTL